MANTIHLHRVLKAPVSRVFKAFTDPEANVVSGRLCPINFGAIMSY